MRKRANPYDRLRLVAHQSNGLRMVIALRNEYVCQLNQELIHGNFLSPLNLGWAPNETQTPGASGWEHTCDLSFSGALS